MNGPAISDGAISLRPMAADELPCAHAMSTAEDARAFIVPNTMERFRLDFATPGVVYLSIVDTESGPGSERLAGYFILVLEADGAGVECRRLVVGRKSRGIGKRALRLLDRYCRESLGRRRIWLDVYDFNTRGQRVYESCGYRFMDRAKRDGKTLLFYEKHL